MKVGVVITMYDEHLIALKSVAEIKKTMPDSTIVLVHSDDIRETPELTALKKDVTRYIKLPDLSKTLTNQQALGASCIARNYSTGFNSLYETGEEYDLVVALTAATHISDGRSFYRRWEELQREERAALVSQAIGQNFHAVAEDGSRIDEGRHQNTDTTDFMPQLFFLDGSFAVGHEVLKDIKVTNPYTSEQCLGDGLVDSLTTAGKSFYNDVSKLNWFYPTAAYAYADGVEYHALHDGQPAGREK